MKTVCICILLVVVASSILAGAIAANINGNTPVSRTTARKLIKDDSDGGDIGLEDYRPVDPSPSSKKVRPGPINHGTPLIPYIPKPSPPPRPRV